MHLDGQRSAEQRLVVMVDAGDRRLFDLTREHASRRGMVVESASFLATGSLAANLVVAWVVEFNDPYKLQGSFLCSALSPPVIAIVGDQDGLGLEAMRRGAWDAIRSSSAETQLGSVVDLAIQAGMQRAEDRGVVADYLACSKKLTNPERVVLDAIVQGKLNKQIAKEMDVSIRTVEQRRSKIFSKMKVSSAVPLARRVAQVETLQRLCDHSAGLSPSF